MGACRIQGNTALVLASCFGHEGIMKLLLDRAEADVNLTTISVRELYCDRLYTYHIGCNTG
jgi:hypothetical protein